MRLIHARRRCRLVFHARTGSCQLPPRLLTLAIALLMLPTIAFSQTHYRSNVAVGVKGGIDLSQTCFNPKVKQGWLPGAVMGVAVRYIEENHFGLIAELDFAQRGWKEDFEGRPFNYSRTLSYLEIPVLAHIYFGRRGRFFVNLGPQIGVFLGDKISSNFNPSEIANISGYPVSGRRNEQQTLPINGKIDFGISGSLGCEFSINRKHELSLEARFYYGLGNTLKSGRTQTFKASNQMSIAATLGYWFRVK